MKRFVGYDRNKEILYLGDRVAIYTDYTGHPYIGEGTLVTHDNWVYVEMEEPVYEKGKFFPFTPQLSLDMGQMGIWGLNIEFEKL